MRSASAGTGARGRVRIRARTRLALVALAASVAVALSGCVAPTAVTSTPAAVDATTDPALAAFYGQTLTWTSCANGFQCSTAEVPIDYAAPAAGSVRLALTRKTATGTRLGSLLVNPGGPGGSGYDFVQQSFSAAVSPALAASYDIVGFDPRGVGHSSSPVTCHTTSAQLDSYLYDIVPGAVGSAGWIAGTEAKQASFDSACQAGTGALLGHLTTVDAARDLDILRAVLGDPRLNYLGYSYGTFLGATYAGLFPARTGRLVLDGALDPSISEFQLTLGQAKGFESALRAYLADCLTRSGCPFAGRTVDASEQYIAQLFTSVDRSPLTASDGRQLGLSALFQAAAYPLYSSSTWRYLDTLFSEVSHGQTKTAFLLADALNSRDASGHYTDNSTEANIAINCSDYPNVSDTVTMQTQAAQIVAAAPVFGQAMTYGGLTCRGWPAPATAPRAPITAAGSADILVVGTSNDPATPYAWAVALAGQLQHGHLISRTGEGHTGYNKGNSCVDGAVEGYLIRGVVPASDPHC